MIGRPTAGASIEAVEAEMNALMEAIRLEKAGQDHSFLATHFTFRAFPGVGLAPSLRSPTSRTLSILAGSAALLLLLACANIANLGLARAASLSGAIMVRRALGASGAAVAAERIIESALVGLAGGALGVILGAGAIGGLRASGLGLLGVPLDGVSLDGRVVAFTTTRSGRCSPSSGSSPRSRSDSRRSACCWRQSACTVFWPSRLRVGPARSGSAARSARSRGARWRPLWGAGCCCRRSASCRAFSPVPG
jgi:hypothetical protein